MPKKRTLNQQSEAEARGMLESLLSQWVVNSLKNDFGFDFEVRITDSSKGEHQEVTEYSFYIQLKSTIHPVKNEVVEDLNIDDWELYISQQIPVLLIKYDKTNKTFYWEIIHDYVWDVLDKKNPNWRNQNYSRIILSKKLDDLNLLKEAILNSQKRITRYQFLNLNIGDGIKIDKDNLKESKSHSEKYLAEYKNMCFKLGYIESQKGNKEESINQFLNVYNSPKNDQIKIKALVAVVSYLSVLDQKENAQILKFSDEGIELSRKLDLIHFENYLNILKNIALHFNLIQKIAEIHIISQIPGRTSDLLLNLLSNKELVDLLATKNIISKKISKSSSWLLKNNHIHYYIDSLTKTLDMIALQITYFANLNKEIIKEEKYRSDFISNCENLSTIISDSRLKQGLLKSLANYYYWNCKYDEALKTIYKAVEIAKTENDLKFINACEEFIRMMKAKPNPYVNPKSHDFPNINITELQEMFYDLIKYQGININAPNKTSELVKIALDDIDPSSYFKYCQFLHIAYSEPDNLGKRFGLPTLCSKLIWCKYCKNEITGFSLKKSFDLFKTTNCMNCSNLTPRNTDWTCTYEYIMKQEDEKEFVDFLSNYK